MLVLRHEDVAARPDSIAAEFHRFLGVPELPETAHALGRINAAEIARHEPLSPSLRRRLVERYRAANANLATLLGPISSYGARIERSFGRQHGRSGRVDLLTAIRRSVENQI
jgi:hypothetical protein